MAKKILMLLLVCLLLLNTGCWDKQDIEERALVLGIAFDKPPEEELARQRENASEPEHFSPRYSITYIHPLASTVVGKGAGEDTFSSMTITTRSPKEAEREMNTRIDLQLFFGHTDLILFGEDVLKNEEYMKEMMDYLHRNQNINWDAKVAVVQGRAKDVFEMKPTGANLLVPYVVGIMENRRVSSRVSHVTLTQMLTELGQRGTVVLPKINLGKDEVKVEGAAIIQNFKFRGYFTGQEARSLMFLKGTLQGGGIVTKYEDTLISYTIGNSKLEKKLKTTEDGLQMIFKLRTEGQLDEGTYNLDLMDDKLIKTMEKSVAEEITKDAMETIKKLQREYKADVIRVGSYIQKFHPKIWKQVEKDWEEVFSSMDIQVQTDARIRRVGVVE